MIAPRLLGYHRASERKVMLLALDELETPYAVPSLNGGHFVCFCAMDAKRLPVEELSKFCAQLLQRGCAYLCAWGPDCERVHDIMDQLVVGSNPPDSYVGCVMTTWHADESLEDALEFFLNGTAPDEDYAPDGCHMDLIVSVGSSQWISAIEQYVSGEIEPAE